MKVYGRCPRGCGETLFLGSGGYVTCSWIECPEPDAAARLLNEAETLQRRLSEAEAEAERLPHLAGLKVAPGEVLVLVIPERSGVQHEEILEAVADVGLAGRCLLIIGDDVRMAAVAAKGRR